MTDRERIEPLQPKTEFSFFPHPAQQRRIAEVTELDIAKSIAPIPILHELWRTHRMSRIHNLPLTGLGFTRFAVKMMTDFPDLVAETADTKARLGDFEEFLEETTAAVLKGEMKIPLEDSLPEEGQRTADALTEIIMGRTKEIITDKLRARAPWN